MATSKAEQRSYFKCRAEAIGRKPIVGAKDEQRLTNPFGVLSFRCSYILLYVAALDGAVLCIFHHHHVSCRHLGRLLVARE